MTDPSPTASRWLLLMIAVVGLFAGAGAILLATHSSGRTSTSTSSTSKPIIQGGIPPAPPPRPGPPAALSALQTTEAFAAAYAAFLAGGRPASGVPYASRPLARRLEQLHPQRPGAIAATGDPQLTSVHITPTTKTAATATAVIADGPSLSALALRLTKRGRAWVVVDLSESG